MKTPFQPGCAPMVLVAALLVTPFSQTHAADRDPSQPPEKLGSRIVNFFKGLVDRDEPSSGYNEYPANRPYTPPQGQGRQPRRFNLDAPPPIPGGPSSDDQLYDEPVNRAPRSRPGNPAANPDEAHDPPTPSSQRQDLPYETPPAEAPTPARSKPAPDASPRQESPPPMTKNTTPKSSPSQKPVESTSKSASGSHSPVTTTSPMSTPDSPPAPEPRRQESPPSPPDSPSSASTPSTTPKPPAPASSGTAGAPLVGTKTAKPGRVKSPYPPYNELDVTGLSSGSLAMDPTTQKVFRVP